MVAELSHIFAISAQLKYNIDAVRQYITQNILPNPSGPCLVIVRSFNVSKPSGEVEDLKGGTRQTFCRHEPTGIDAQCESVARVSKIVIRSSPW